MSLLERTITAFPRGRTSEELFALLDVDFDPHKRASILSELNVLQEQGRVRRGRDGRWRSARATAAMADTPNQPGRNGVSSTFAAENELRAITAFSKSTSSNVFEDETLTSTNFDTKALLRYYRSVLRADPRGAITQQTDRHGMSWQLLSGFDFRTPDELEEIEILVDLEELPGEIRQKLSRDVGEENALAIGWPIAVVKQHGVPCIMPVGLIAAEWARSEGMLSLRISADDVLVNPEWIKSAARPLGWRPPDLHQFLEGADRGGLPLADFRLRLKEAAASQILGGLPAQLSRTLDPQNEGVHSALALFLPTETTFTAGVVGDLDKIAVWPDEIRNHTALGALFDGQTALESIPALSVGPLNAEQIQAVRYACSKPLTVVTGPPGTGKSQAITAIVASVLAAGGRVLVASKNHQALDAVEDRLSGIASNVTFGVRTLDPYKEIDESFRSALAKIVQGVGPSTLPVLDLDTNALNALALKRDSALDARTRHDALRSALADVIERLALRQNTSVSGQPPESIQRMSLLGRIFELLRLRRKSDGEVLDASKTFGLSAHALRKRAVDLKKEIASLDLSEDPVGLSDSVTKHAMNLLPKLLANRCFPSDEQRQTLALAQADAELAGATHQMGRDIARMVVQLRPLWLASILGAPKRIPLEPGLFDLVIFDEASQCDIASSLPLFARARRAVVVGDDMQLSSVAQLGIAQDRNLMTAQGLGTAGMGRFAQSRQTLFDLANSTPGAARVMLRDQYRSASEIVGYISDQFYRGTLRPAGPPDRFKPPRGMKPGIAWTDVPAPSLPQRGNVNPAEVAAIVGHLRTLLVEQAYSGSVGVITPFRPQVAAIADAVRGAIDTSLLDGVDFKAGTVDSFQGQERDLILFSPCIGPAAAASAVQFIQRDWRRLNVAISRARAVAHVFGDLAYAKSGKVTSLQRLAVRATEPRRAARDGDFDSHWERKVFHALKERGLDPVPQYEIAGRRLDFALFGVNDIKLDLEVDGRHWHTDTDGNRKQTDLWRDDMLRSLGWRVRRFWVDELAENMEKCIDLVERDLA